MYKNMPNVGFNFTLKLAFILLLPATALAGGSLSGSVFIDYDADGGFDLSATASTSRDTHLAGVSVNVYDSSGTLSGATTTVRCTAASAPSAFCIGADTGPNYSIASLTGTGPYRVEFSWPNGSADPLRLFQASTRNAFSSGGSGVNNASSSVHFVSDGGGANVNFALNRPSDYCQGAPNLAAPIMIYGDSSAGAFSASPVLIDFPITAGLDEFPAVSGAAAFQAPTTHTLSVPNSQLGATFGLSYHKRSRSLFSSAYYKRHVDFGPNGPGAIYITPLATGIPSLFVDLNSSGYLSGALGTDTHPASPNTSLCSGSPSGAQDCWFHDVNTFDAVGKQGLGDIDLSENQQDLYVMDLARRKVLRLPVGDTPTAPTLSSITQYPTDGDLTALNDIVESPPLSNDCPSLSTDIRPFGLGFHNGRIFVGMVCTAESSRAIAAFAGEINKIWGYVYSFDPSGPGTIASFRREVKFNFQSTNANASLVAWMTGAQWTAGSYLSQGFSPAISDIEFDGDDMNIGVRNIAADQIGYQNAGTLDITSGGGANSLAYGDLYRACWNGTTWDLETNGSCGSRTSANGVGDSSGPGGGSFFPAAQTFSASGGGVTIHGVTGALAQVPGFESAVITGWDGYGFLENSVTQMSNIDGDRTRTYTVFVSSDRSTFSKANGLGDIEALCEAAPIEIGNRVWKDSNSNGIQDPGEPVLGNVTVSLYNGSNALVASATTDPTTGEYYFTNRSGSDSASERYGLPLSYDASYSLRLDNPSDYSGGGPLVALTLTETDDNIVSPSGSDLNDSDATSETNPTGSPSGSFPVVRFTLGSPGENNHTFDFGLMDAATAEIGDFVWMDDGDGVQESGEMPIGGVTVNLYNAAGTSLLATAVTDSATGLYLFSSAAGTTTSSRKFGISQLTPNTSFIIRLDNPTDYLSGGPLFQKTVTTAFSGPTTTDSNIQLPSPSSPIGTGNYPQMSVATGGASSSVLTFDAGFVAAATPTATATPSPTVTGTPSPTATATPTTAPTPVPAGCEIVDYTKLYPDLIKAPKDLYSGVKKYNKRAVSCSKNRSYTRTASADNRRADQIYNSYKSSSALLKSVTVCDGECTLISLADVLTSLRSNGASLFKLSAKAQRAAAKFCRKGPTSGSGTASSKARLAKLNADLARCPNNACHD